MGIFDPLADCEQLMGEELSAVNGDVGGRSPVFIINMGGGVLDGLCEESRVLTKLAYGHHGHSLRVRAHLT